MRDGGGLLDVFDDTEEIGGLNDNGGGVFGDRARQGCEVELARIGVVSELVERDALVLRLGLQHFAIFGMHAAGGEDVTAAGRADRHHGGFGDGG